MAFARTIIESHIAVKTIDEEIKKVPRLIDIYDGIKWRLARQPEGGYRVPKTKPQTWVIHSYHWGIAAVVVAYHFDDDQVEILVVKVELIH
jgi:hypothetical protein